MAQALTLFFLSTGIPVLLVTLPLYFFPSPSYICSVLNSTGKFHWRFYTYLWRCLVLWIQSLLSSRSVRCRTEWSAQKQTSNSNRLCKRPMQAQGRLAEKFKHGFQGHTAWVHDILTQVSTCWMVLAGCLISELQFHYLKIMEMILFSTSFDCGEN